MNVYHLGKRFPTEVHRRLCAMDVTEAMAEDPIKYLLRITRDVARQHPIWFLEFKIWGLFQRAPHVSLRQPQT